MRIPSSLIRNLIDRIKFGKQMPDEDYLAWGCFVPIGVVLIIAIIVLSIIS
jgi:hypothetical protein